MKFMERMRLRARTRAVEGWIEARRYCTVQHDFDIADGPGASVRGDLNDSLEALVTWNSGAADPATTFPRMRSIQTTAGVVKRRNAANSAWIVESTDDETRVLSRSGNTMLDVSDIGKAVLATGTWSQTFDAAATLTDGWYVDYRNDSTGTITLDPNGAELINAAATLELGPGASCRIWCNGTGLKAVGLSTGPTKQAFTSGTAATYTRPSGCIRIRVRMVAGAGSGSGATSTSGASPSGNNGTASVFGGVTANPGLGATTTLGGVGGQGGAGTGDTGTTLFKRVPGSPGGHAGIANTAGLYIGGSGNGGGTVFGGGSVGRNTTGTGAAPVANTGAGSAGAYDTVSTYYVMGAGGGGGEGVEFIIVNPAATYSYTVGLGGAASAGTQVSSAGAAGYILVEEFY